jgi:hypothetical protein
MKRLLRRAIRNLEHYRDELDDRTTEMHHGRRNGFYIAGDMRAIRGRATRNEKLIQDLADFLGRAFPAVGKRTNNRRGEGGCL